MSVDTVCRLVVPVTRLRIPRRSTRAEVRERVTGQQISIHSERASVVRPARGADTNPSHRRNQAFISVSYGLGRAEFCHACVAS